VPQVQEVAALHDPCPLPDKQKKRSLSERERLVYAPMSGGWGRLRWCWEGSGRQVNARFVWAYLLLVLGGTTLVAGCQLTVVPVVPADVGGLLFDKDAVYIDIPDWKVGLLFTLCLQACHQQ
jgi:hypothetical protein